VKGCGRMWKMNCGLLKARFIIWLYDIFGKTYKPKRKKNQRKLTKEEIEDLEYSGAGQGY
jgi:hypothetical protein